MCTYSLTKASTSDYKCTRIHYNYIAQYLIYLPGGLICKSWIFSFCLGMFHDFINFVILFGKYVGFYLFYTHLLTVTTK